MTSWSVLGRKTPDARPALRIDRAPTQGIEPVAASAAAVQTFANGLTVGYAGPNRICRVTHYVLPELAPAVPS